MMNMESADNLDDVNATAKCELNDSSKTLNLHDEFICSEILPRLPVKSLIRFKSVSKSWYSCITSSKFAKKQLNFSSSSAHQFILPNIETVGIRLLPYDEQNNLKTPVEINVPDDSRFDKEPYLIDIEVVGVCNGLLCLCFKKEGLVVYKNYECSAEGWFFSIWNPASHQYCEISNPDSLIFGSGNWFGYVPSIDDYKIFVSFISNKHGNDIDYYVYSLRRKTWKLLSVLDKVLSGKELLTYNIEVVDDTLYWSPCSISNDERLTKHIVGLNLVTEQVKLFSWMDWLSAYGDTNFFVINGFLSLYCSSYVDDDNQRDYKPVSDVWTLKQNDDWSSWEKKFSVHHGGMYLALFTPTRKFLVNREFLFNMTQFKLIDATKDAEEQSQGEACLLADRTIGCGGGLYVESLIWPYSTIKSAEEEEDSQV
ncbi:hypothetical protein RDABS01_011370 [Bienertia sinuspersici]